MPHFSLAAPLSLLGDKHTHTSAPAVPMESCADPEMYMAQCGRADVRCGEHIPAQDTAISLPPHTTAPTNLEPFWVCRLSPQCWGHSGDVGVGSGTVLWAKPPNQVLHGYGHRTTHQPPGWGI